MIYSETNVINVNYILPYAPIVNNINLCDRDEIADPRKLLLLIDSCPKEWSIYHYNNKYFYSILIPWNKTYNSYGNKIESHYFRVLCQNPSMFTLKNISTEDCFKKNYCKLFLISHVITSTIEYNEINKNIFTKKYISKNNNSLVSLTNIVKNSDEEMNIIIMNKCYTMCNGVILLLALHRLNIIDSSITKNNLEMLTQHGYKMIFNYNNNDNAVIAAPNANNNEINADDINNNDNDSENINDNDSENINDNDSENINDNINDSDNENENENILNNNMNTIYNNNVIRIDQTKIYTFIQPVNDDWEELYYAFPLVQLSDHPIYYIYSGPNFVDISVKQLFTGANEINIYWPPHNAAYYSFPVSTIFPHFNITYMDEYINNFRIRNIMLDRADDLMNPNEEAIEINNDYAGLIQVFYKTTIGYTYWDINKAYISSVLFNTVQYKQCYKFIKIAFHYYIHETEVNKKCISNIWCDLLNNAFIKESINKQSELIIRVTMMLYIYYSNYINFNIVDPNKIKIPLDFIKYVLAKCNNTHIHKIYTIPSYVKNLQMKYRMQHLFPNIIFEPHNEDAELIKYKLNINLISLCNLVSIHKAYIEKLIITRLLCLKYLTKDYAVYFPINEYIRNNKYLLF